MFTWASACTCSFPFIDMLTLMMLCVKMLFGFVWCDAGITGAALGTKILSTLQGYGLDLKKLRGQAYDGAANNYVRTYQRSCSPDQGKIPSDVVLTLCITLPQFGCCEILIK